jgi:hypothetical protein
VGVRAATHFVGSCVRSHLPTGSRTHPSIYAGTLPGLTTARFANNPMQSGASSASYHCCFCLGRIH